jgi:predicted nucleic acid-binding protein
MIVADTNLLVHLFVYGPHTSEVEAVLRKDQAWAAPPLWRSEFRNALIGLFRRGDVTRQETDRLVEAAEEWMSGREYAVESRAVLRLAAESGCSAYDCEFVSVAVDLGVSLVTIDRELLRAFPSIASHPKAFLA